MKGVYGTLLMYHIVLMKKIIKLLSGPILFVLIMLLIPNNTVPYAVKGAIGIFIWMSVWWITTPVDVAVTALLPIAVNALFGFVPMNSVISKYASDLVILLLGANIITITWEATGLNQRIALSVLSVIGPSMKSQITVWFVGSTIMSIFLPNVVVAATLTPIAMAMLKSVGKGIPKESLCAANILLAIAWGAGLGGFGSPLGGGMNLVSIGYIESITGTEYMYIDWVYKMMPFLIAITLGCLAYMVFMKSETKVLPGAKEYFKEEYSKLGKMSKEELLSAILFIVPVILAFTREFYKDILPALSSSYSFIVFAIIAFMLPGKINGRLITWKYTQPKLAWGLFYTLAGGLAMGVFITDSGASDMIAQIVTNSGISSTIILAGVFILLSTILSNISSNNAACAITIPIVISITKALNLNPIGYIYLTSIGGNCAFLLPTSTRALPVANGVEPKYMLKQGFALVGICFVITLIVGLLALKYWPFFLAA